MRLGRTDLMVSRSGFGALPIQRVDTETVTEILQAAVDKGINFFDTARNYSDSEEKIGRALSHVRQDIIIATKTHAPDRGTLFKDLETSLQNLKTDYIDIYQLHAPRILPDPNDPDSLYGGLLEAQKKGMIRFIGITNHRLDVAMDAARSEKYDTVQFPFSSISAEKDLELVETCRERDLGFIAMKALSGGLITNAASTFAFLRELGNIVPIWGIQHMSELEEFIAFENSPPLLDEKMWEVINKDRAELAGNFCRGCGYCMPCPEEILIQHSARMDMLLKRAPYQNFITDRWKGWMDRIENCTECEECKEKCPYELDTPKLLKYQLENYRKFYADHVQG